ncbi:AIPR family protein [Pedobacter sp. KLB.chiD]|uniref:AIPR family protein n=1 Tax=Pedobacter sp. KLB.chiD TaxID=3387402 RepID=UPI00399C0D93
MENLNPLEDSSDLNKDEVQNASDQAQNKVAKPNSQIKILLEGCLGKFTEDNALVEKESEIFELFCLFQITKSLDIAFEEIQDSIVDGGNDGGIDSLMVLIDDNYISAMEDIDDITFSRKTAATIIISQCKKESSFKEAAVDKIITTLPELFDLSKNQQDLLIRFNADLTERAEIARLVWQRCSANGGKLEVIFNYCSFAEEISVNGAFRSKTAQLEQLAKDRFYGSTVVYNNYSCKELLTLYSTQKLQRLAIRYKETPLSTSFGEAGIGYVGTVKLADYKAFLTDEDSSIREDLFESNIRHFQGLVDVNKKIKETIESNHNEDFWWLNNGITIIASAPSLVGTVLSVDNVQIVNGLQTSYSIFLNHDGDKSDLRSVMVKVIINEEKAIIDHIIASTNSQNPVSAALLRATDEIQRNIELHFLNKGYYYDRRKNYYKNQGKPVSKIFSIQTAAQAVESILFDNPYSARSKPTSLIKEDNTYNKIFNKQFEHQIFLNCCLILKATGEYLAGLENRELKNKLSNFKLHIARIATSFILNKEEYTLEDLSTLDLGEYTTDKFNSAYNVMSNAIDSFQKDNPNSNLINMAKSKGVTDVMLNDLSTIFLLA